MRFTGTSGSGSVRVGADGLPRYVTQGGDLIPLEVGREPAALHSDPSFEDPALTDWDFTWFTGTTSVTSETDDAIDSGLSATVTVSAGVGNEQILLSDSFSVSPGEVIEAGVFAHKVTGTPLLVLGLLSRPPGGTPVFLDGVSTGPETAATELRTEFGQFKSSFTVPAGHTAARIYFRVGNTAGEAVEARLDSSFSARTGTTAPYLESAQVAQSAAVTPNGTADSTLTGLSVTVTSPGSTSVYMASIDADVTFAGAQTNIIELLVDGAAQTAQLITGAAATGHRVDGHKTWRVTGLAAGAHTFTARTRNTAAGTNATVNLTHTLMTVLRVSG